MASRGRPLKLTPALQTKICKVIADGNTKKDSSIHCGITYDTFARWQAKGREATSGIFHDFCKAIKKAEADAIVVKVKVISKAARKTWTAAAWWLERRHPNNWAKTERQEITGRNGGPVQYQDATTKEQIESEHAEIMERSTSRVAESIGHRGNGSAGGNGSDLQRHGSA